MTVDRCGAEGAGVGVPGRVRAVGDPGRRAGRPALVTDTAKEQPQQQRNHGGRAHRPASVLCHERVPAGRAWPARKVGSWKADSRRPRPKRTLSTSRAACCCPATTCRWAGTPRCVGCCRAATADDRCVVFRRPLRPRRRAGRPGMQVPPHPHTGLQTVTWLVDGESPPRQPRQRPADPSRAAQPDDLRARVSPIRSTPARASRPDARTAAVDRAARRRPGTTPPRFEHHADLPAHQHGDATITVVVGELAGARSPARSPQPARRRAAVCAGAGDLLPVDPAFEHGVLVMSGAATVADTDSSRIAALPGPGPRRAAFGAPGPARLFLLGGEPFDEPLVMWWNFVGRSHDEIVAARDDWMAGRRFGPSAAAPPTRCPHRRCPAAD